MSFSSANPSNEPCQAASRSAMRHCLSADVYAEEELCFSLRAFEAHCHRLASSFRQSATEFKNRCAPHGEVPMELDVEVGLASDLKRSRELVLRAPESFIVRYTRSLACYRTSSRLLHYVFPSIGSASCGPVQLLCPCSSWPTTACCHSSQTSILASPKLPTQNPGLY